ncbi:hypothetical protein [Lysinibacillus antri]|uniref:Uncharacterized protein n=1 Tax=Lysinibacillus antri TaxID=2498145 RepID=A0A3S0P4A7_9BACI|nr:hypothetical protein [Lysinibacillus antri]RUL49134.1 hypothetical protein EK386_15725 [Lysinibacillus antri]
MVNNLSGLALLCSTGSILVVLGIILKIPPIFQIILLIIGLALCIIGIFSLAKMLLGEKSK